MKPRAHLGVYALFVALVAVYTWPLVTEPARLLPGNVDSRLFSWVMLTAFGNTVAVGHEETGLGFELLDFSLEASGPR